MGRGKVCVQQCQLHSIRREEQSTAGKAGGEDCHCFCHCIVNVTCIVIVIVTDTFPCLIHSLSLSLLLSLSSSLTAVAITSITPLYAIHWQTESVISGLVHVCHSFLVHGVLQQYVLASSKHSREHHFDCLCMVHCTPWPTPFLNTHCSWKGWVVLSCPIKIWAVTRL